MNFNTAYYETGQLIKERTVIAKKYLTSNFLWDFIVVAPFFINQYFKVNYVDMILLLRQKKIRHCVKSYEELVNLRKKNKGIYDLCKLVFAVLFVAHFVGCFFYFLGS